MATTQNWLDLSEQGDVLPVGRVPDGPAAGQQPAQPADRGARRARRWPSWARTSTRSWRARRSPAWATAASAGWPPATSTRWPRWNARRSATASATSSGSSSRRSHDGWQIEKTDNWLSTVIPWEIDKPDASYLVNWGGHTEEYEDVTGKFRVRWVPQRGAQGRLLRHPDPGLRRQHLQHADAVERAGGRIVRAGSLQHRRLLQGRRRSRWSRRRSPRCSTPTTNQRPASGCGCCSSTSS